MLPPVDKAFPTTASEWPNSTAWDDSACGWIFIVICHGKWVVVRVFCWLDFRVLHPMHSHKWERQRRGTLGPRIDSALATNKQRELQQLSLFMRVSLTRPTSAFTAPTHHCGLVWHPGYFQKPECPDLGPGQGLDSNGFIRLVRLYLTANNQLERREAFAKGTAFGGTGYLIACYFVLNRWRKSKTSAIQKRWLMSRS